MKTAPKVILHVDMDAFFASIEQLDHPEYRGRPVIVGAPPDRRGVVAAASYEARQYGVHSAMPSRTAYLKCPRAVFLPPRRDRYEEVSGRIMELFESYTPLVQPLSIDEAFLDVTGARRLFGDGPTVAEKIRRDIRAQTGLTASVGVAPNLFLAKIASDMNKPDGITAVPSDPAAIKQFLAPLPIGSMWGVGRVTQKKMRSLGITTFGRLQQYDPKRLENAFGKRAAAAFRRLACGIDERSLCTGRPDQSISNETTFREDVTDRAEIEAACLQLIDKVGRRLRKADLFATTVHLKLRWSDFSTITRQARPGAACRDDITLREIGMDLLHRHLQDRPVRLVGFGVSGLAPTADRLSAQLELFNAPDRDLYEKRERLSDVADRIRSKFGDRSLRRGSSLDPEKSGD